MNAEKHPPRLDDETLQRLGLSRQPFSGSDFFFVDSEIEARLHMAQHLLQDTDTVIILSAPAGVGRTSFLNRLPRDADGLHCFHLSASPETTIGEITETIAGTESPGGVKEVVGALMPGPSGKAAILVDDAETLPNRPLRILLELRNRASIRGASPGLMLAVTEDHEEGLRGRLTGAGVAEDAIQVLRLRPFTESQTAAYLTARLSAAGESTDSLLSDRDKRRIHKQTQGVPALINAEAAALLSGAERQPAAGLETLRNISGVHYAVAGVVAVLVAGLLILNWMARSPAPERSETTVAMEVPPPENTPSPSDVKARDKPGEGNPAPSMTEGSQQRIGLASSSVDDRQEPEKAAPVTGTESTAGPVTATDDADSTEVSATQPQTATTAPDDSEELTSAPSAEDTDSAAEPETAATDQSANESAASAGDAPKPTEPTMNTTESAAAKQQEEQQAAPEPKRSEPEPVKEAPTQQADGKKEIASAGKPEAATPESERSGAEPEAGGKDEWLAERDAKHYTIQLLGAYETATVERFITNNGLKRSVHVVETTRKGRPWHVVVKGDYPSRQAAHEGVGRLPEALRVAGPWVRSFGSLR